MVHGLALLDDKAQPRLAVGADLLSRAGFGAEVRAALDRRIDTLAEQGLARREGDKVTIGRNLVGTLRSRELDAIGQRLASETGLAHLPAETGERVEGTYSRRLSLASGRFAMIDNGLGFQLVPWIPSLERELGRQVNGIAGPGGVEWSFGRSATFPFNPPISTPSCA